MKNLAVIALLLLTIPGIAQKKKEGKPYFDFAGGVQKIDKKIFKEPRKTALVFAAVRFNTSIMHHDAEGDKAFSKSRVDAYTWAHLKGVSDQDFQEIADDFQQYLQQKLNSAGFSEVAWSEIETNESYKKEISKPEERKASFKDGSAHIVFTGKNVPFFKASTAPMTKMSRHLKSNIIAVGAELNFADLGLAIEKNYSESSWEDAAYAYKERKLKFSAESSIVPVLKVQTNADVLQNMSKVDAFSDFNVVQGTLQRPLLSNAEFVSSLSKEDVADKQQSSGAKILRALNPDMNGIASTNTDSYTVTADAAQYKTAAIELLHRYADHVVETMSSYQK